MITLWFQHARRTTLRDPRYLRYPSAIDRSHSPHPLVLLTSAGYNSELCLSHNPKFQFVMTQFVMTQFVMTQFVMTQFVMKQFVMTQFVMTQFVMTEFVMTQFVMTQFVMTQFVMTQFVTTQFVMTQSVMTQFVMTQFPMANVTFCVLTFKLPLRDVISCSLFIIPVLETIAAEDVSYHVTQRTDSGVSAITLHRELTVVCQLSRYTEN